MTASQGAKNHNLNAKKSALMEVFLISLNRFTENVR